MTQHNLTQILKVIRDFVMRNRPCYRDYLGSETVTKTVQIGAGTFAAKSGSAMAEFPATDSDFTGFVLGETYTVTIDGVTADYVARNLSPISDEVGPIIGTTTTCDMGNNTFDGWLAASDNTPEALVCFAQTFDMSFAGKTISISQTKTETVTHYKTKLLPEYLLPAFLRKNVVATKTEVQSAAATATAAKDAANSAQSTADAAQTAANSAQSTADAAQTAANTAQTTANAAKTAADNAQTTANAAQSTASAKFQLMQQTTVKTTATIGTVSYNADSSVKGLNIAVGSTIKVTAADGAFSGTVIWNAPYRNIDIYNNATGRKIGLLTLELLQDGETYKFTNRTAGMTLSNLVIEYKKVEIPKTISTARSSGAWLPPYLIANCLYLTKDSADSGLATLYRITVDDTGTLKATEVT